MLSSLYPVIIKSNKTFERQNLFEEIQVFMEKNSPYQLWLVNIIISIYISSLYMSTMNTYDMVKWQRIQTMLHIKIIVFSTISFLLRTKPG